MLKQILFVEDNREHQAAAYKALEARGLTGIQKDGKLYQTKAGTFESFLGGLQLILKSLEKGDLKKGEVGILSDLYFPADQDSLYGGADLAPLGLLVMSECLRFGIPCVIVTAGYHHGKRYDELHKAGLLMKWPNMVDAGDWKTADEEAPAKNWEKGLDCLAQLAQAAEIGAG